MSALSSASSFSFTLSHWRNDLPTLSFQKSMKPDERDEATSLTKRWVAVSCCCSSWINPVLSWHRLLDISQGWFWFLVFKWDQEVRSAGLNNSLGAVTRCASPWFDKGRVCDADLHHRHTKSRKQSADVEETTNPGKSQREHFSFACRCKYNKTFVSRMKRRVIYQRIIYSWCTSSLPSTSSCFILLSNVLEQWQRLFGLISFVSTKQWTSWRRSVWDRSI